MAGAGRRRSSGGGGVDEESFIRQFSVTRDTVPVILNTRNRAVKEPSRIFPEKASTRAFSWLAKILK